jgi:hypothetical protein
MEVNVRVNMQTANRMVQFACLALTVALFLVGSLDCSAQSNLATIQGHVTDPSGTTISGATVTITNVATNGARTSTTNDQGDYTIPYLVPGTYKVSVTSAGFQRLVANDVALAGTEIRRFDVQLKVGSAHTDVVVTGGGEAVIQTENAQINSGFTQKTYENSPVSTQIFPTAQMVFLPQVVSEQGGYGLVIAGLQPSQIEESMDGIGNDGSYNLVNNAHAMQDLQVISSVSPAEYSRGINFTSTGIGGSNAFHGMVGFDEANSALNARLPTQPAKTSFKTHYFTGEIGGPLRRDKTFFYVNYILYVVPSGSFNNENVPDTLERQGNFSEFTTPLKDPFTGGTYANNTLPAINSVALAMQNSYIPTYNQGPGGPTANNYGYLFPHPSDLYKYDSWNGRVDHNFSSKHSLYGAYINRTTPYLLAGSFPNVGTWTRNRYSHSSFASDTYTFTSNLVNNFRFGWQKDHIHDGIEELGFTPITGNVAVSAIGLQGVNPTDVKVMGFPNSTITGFSALTQNTGGIPADYNIFTYTDSVTWQKGNHVAKFGGEIKPWSDYSVQYPNIYGAFTYSGEFTGQPYADFLLGLPTTSEREAPVGARTDHAHELGFYAEDLWKVTPRLTVSYGLRWDFQGWPTYNDGLVYNWDKTTGDVVVSSSEVSKVNPLYPTTITVEAGNPIPHPDKSLIRPRIGVAYRVTDRLVVKGGYGLYTQVIGSNAGLTGGNGGDPIAATLASSTSPFILAEIYSNVITNGQPLIQMPDPFPSSTASASVPSQSVTGYPANASNGKIQEFNVSIERQIRDMGFSIAYSGVRSAGMNYLANINLAQPSLTTFKQSLLPWPQFTVNSGVSYQFQNGQSRYDALVVEAKRNFGHFNFDVHYTYADNRDNWENTQNPYNMNPWNHDVYTIRNVFTGMMTYALPFGRGQQFGGTMPKAADEIAGNWNLTLITTERGGQYFTPSFSGSDPSNSGLVGGIPDRTCNGNLGRSQRSTTQWFNAACFAVPQPGHFGDSGANVIEGPTFNSTDMTLAKNFPVTERVRANFSALFLDLFNTPTYAFPYSNISVPSQVGKVYAPLGGFGVGEGGLVEAGGSRAIVGRLRVDF